MEYSWTYNEEDEVWSNGSDSIKDCIDEARRDLEYESENYKYVYIGRGITYSPQIFVEGLLESLGEDAYSECGEVAEDWLQNVSVAKCQALGEKLNAVLKEWLEEVSEVPTFGRIVDVKKYCLETGDEIVR